MLEGVYRYGIEDGHIRPQDIVFLFAGSTSYQTSRAFAWDFFKRNLTLLIDKFGSINSTLFQMTFKFAANSQSSSAIARDVEVSGKCVYPICLISNTPLLRNFATATLMVIPCTFLSAPLTRLNVFT